MSGPKREKVDRGHYKHHEMGGANQKIRSVLQNW